jgi:holo-[acyl-carrier protein] synthase
MVRKINKFGIGTDIENVDRFTGSDFVQNSVLVNRIFTEREQEYCFSKKIAAPHLTARYCGKEAIVKALASVGGANVRYIDIEIINKQDGMPVARVDKEGFRDLQIYLSLSHCRDKAIAFAIVMGME